MDAHGTAGGGGGIPTGGTRYRRSPWTAPCVAAAMVASLFLSDPADASRAEAQRRAGRAAASRVAAEPGVDLAAPGLAEFARALAEGRMADATRIADRMAASPPAPVNTGDAGDAAQLPVPARNLVCARILTLQAAFAAFPSVSGVFVRLLATFECPPAPGTTTTTGFSATSTSFGGSPPTRPPGGSTVPTGPTTTLPTCQAPTTNVPQTTVACTPPSTTSTTVLGSTTTFPVPSTVTTVGGGPTTIGPSTTLPPCLNIPQTTTVPCQPQP